MIGNFSNFELESIARIIGDLYTNGQLTTIFSDLNLIENNQGVIKPSKWFRIRNAIRNQTDLHNLLETAFIPAHFVEKPDIWHQSVDRVNRILRFHGYELDQQGNIVIVEQTKTLKEAEKRANSLVDLLTPMTIHPYALKFCIPELLQENYFHAIFEASKGILDRLRDMNSSQLDGTQLIEQSFSTKNVCIVPKNNKLQNQNEKSQFLAIKHLLLTINYLYRNDKAHVLRFYNPEQEDDAIIALTMISKAHYLLDNCVCVRFLDN